MLSAQDSQDKSLQSSRNQCYLQKSTVKNMDEKVSFMLPHSTVCGVSIKSIIRLIILKKRAKHLAMQRKKL